MCKFLVLASVLVVATATVQSGSEGPDYSHGFQVLGKMVRQYLHSQPEDVKLGVGVHLVNSGSPNDADARAADDGSVLGVLQNYLQTHEIRIKLPELMPGEGLGRAFKDIVDNFEANPNGSGRGKGKGGGFGGIALMGVMMGKMMAAMGIGGVGLLAMKALMVSAMALMLSMIVGIKKLAGGHDEGGHTVIHATGHGHDHRRKREAADMAYHAWNSES